MNKYLTAFLLITFFGACSPKFVTTIPNKQPAFSPTEPVLVIQKTDTFSNQGIFVGTLKSPDYGFYTNCKFNIEGRNEYNLFKLNESQVQGTIGNDETTFTLRKIRLTSSVEVVFEIK